MRPTAAAADGAHLRENAGENREVFRILAKGLDFRWISIYNIGIQNWQITAKCRKESVV